MKKYIYLFLTLVTVLFLNLTNANSQTYGQLYTDATFDAKTIDVTLAVGGIPGESSVSNGAASYTIPIEVPPGTNGVSPSIAVVYNSMAGNGLLGQGWNLAAGGSITRVGKNIFHDGEVGSVNLDHNDRFALNGSRMVIIEGSYGGLNSKYTLETQNFSTITAYGFFGGGPMNFEVKLKDGTIMEYGNSIDSRFLSEDGSKVIFWNLNRVISSDGNYIDYKYFNSSGEIDLALISYTGNINSGKVPDRFIHFIYTLRSDKNVSYIAGNRLRRNVLIEKIFIKDVPAPAQEDNLAKYFYKFLYSYNKTTSYLNEVKKFDSLENPLNSTIFKYGDIPSTFEKVQQSGFQNLEVDIFPADYNADGYSDLIACSSSFDINTNKREYKDFKVYRKNPNPFNSTYNNVATVSFPPNFNAYVSAIKQNNIMTAADFDGNGTDDLLFGKIGKSGSGSSQFDIIEELVLYYSPTSGNTFASPILLASSTSLWPHTKIANNGNYLLSGDFNGDGKSDIITFFTSSANTSVSQNRIFLNGNSISLLPVNGTFSRFSHNAWHNALVTKVLDFNGDGKDDIMLIDNDHTEIFTYNQSNNSYVSLYHTSYYGYPNRHQLIYFGDFNGDGKTDLLTRGEKNINSSVWALSISTGKDFISNTFNFTSVPNIQSYYQNQIIIGDYNGDGKSDIAHLWNVSGQNASKVDIYYSRDGGNYFHFERSNYNERFSTDPGSDFSYDSDGDGRADIFNRLTKFSPYIGELHFNKQGKENLLQKVKNGLGEVTEFKYKTLTDNVNFYNRGTISAYPVNNIQPSISIVNQLKATNGIGGFSIIDYQYESLKVHKTGKGMMGFTKITTSNITTGFKNIQEYEFSPIYFAPTLKKLSTYKISDNSLISETIFTNVFSDTYAGLKCFWLKTTQAYEVNIFGKSFVNATFEFDDFGNVKKKIVNNNNIEDISITNVIEPTVPNVIPYKIKSSVTVLTRLLNPGYSSTTDFSYTNNGKLFKEKNFFGLAKQVTTEYGYDPIFGNNIYISVSAAGLKTKYNTTTYDSKGRFPIESFNTRNQKSIKSFEPIWGNETSSTGIDGLLVTNEYDNWGKLKKTNLPEGYSILNSFGWDINISEGTIYYHIVAHPGKPDVKIWYDQIGRERKRQQEGHNNEWITTKTTYNLKGNIESTTEPYKVNESILTTINQYDDFNRITTISNTLGSTGLSYSYNSLGELTTTTTSPDGIISSKQTDAAGKLIKATDQGGTLSYTYNSQGNLTQISNSSQNLVLMNTTNMGVRIN